MNKLTVKDLRLKCKTLGGKGYSKMKKADLIQYISSLDKNTPQNKTLQKNTPIKAQIKQTTDTSENVFYERVLQFKTDINKSNSTLDKKNVLKKYTDMKKLLLYVYNSDVYNITSKNYYKFVKNDKKDKTKSTKHYSNLFDLLDDLKTRKITGDKALLTLHNYILNRKTYETIILEVIDKSLKIRMASSEINKVFPKLIKVFKVVLANKYDAKRIEKSNNDWYISRKLDGVRCLAHIDIKNETVVFYSRQGKQFETLGVLEKSLLSKIKNFKENCFLDGEVVDMVDDKENFKGVMEQIKKKNYTMPKPYYYAFDIIRETDFYNLSSKDILTKRLDLLKKTIKDIDNVKYLDQVKYTNELFGKMAKEATDNEWEGLMLRENIKYEGKRTNSLLKFKKMMDDEFKVVSIETGTKDMLDKSTGIMKTRTILAAVRINYNNTKVGSGFSDEERLYYVKNPEKIIGKIITVQYFEKTEDSLRFPIFKGIHGNKRDT